MSAADPDFPANDRLGSVLVVQRAFTPEQCAAVVQGAEELPGEQGTVGGGRADPQRRSTVRWLAPGPATQWVYERMADLIVFLNREFQFDVRGFRDHLQLARYGPGDHFDWHLDLGKGVTSLRKISLTVQLSPPEDYDGGDLEIFTASGQRYPRTLGTAIAFPSFLVHRITPVTRGTRLSLVGWASGPSFR